MNRRRLKYLLIFGVLAIAVTAQLIYRQLTTRSEITFATGPDYGQHLDMMTAFAEEFHAQTGTTAHTPRSEGSLENLRKLESGEIDCCLYQSGARRMKMNSGSKQSLNTDQVRFVCNLYSEVVHVIVRKSAGITKASELGGKRIAIGKEDSGDSAISEVLCDHLGLVKNESKPLEELAENEFKPLKLDYKQIKQKFKDNELDAAFITVGTQADVFKGLSENEDLVYLELDDIDALVESHISLSDYTIPKGLYRRSQDKSVPAKKIRTVALKSQLLCRKDLPDSIVERIAQIALSENFIRKQQLRELFTEGIEFAKAKPEFAMHPGAEHFYDPELKPILNSNFVEAVEGMRSFLVSLLIAGFVAWRSWKNWNIQHAEHRLDRYIRRLLEIERKQVTLGIDAASLQRDEDRLQKLLDAVTDLRQDCLRDFTAHQLNEDRSVDCFLDMCHALSDKINAKLLRVQLDQRFEELAATLQK